MLQMLDAGANQRKMTETMIHFTHANGFPAGSYEKTLDILRKDYRVTAIEKIGHNPLYPVNDNWSNLVDELTSHIRQYSDEPVIGAGHSMGSLLTFMAAYKTPGLFKQLILLDPPLLEGAGALLFQAAKRLGILKRTSLVSQARKRRAGWESTDEAIEYFRGKPLFRKFDPDCLRDYVRYGTEKHENGVKLKFAPDIESEIYRTTPHNLGSFRRVLQIPAIVIIGKNTYKQSPYMLSRFARRQEFEYRRLSFGSHLFPLEYPEHTARLILEAIADLKSK